MSLNISLEQFNAIAKGKYNAGQIDFVEGSRGPKLVKVNNHVHKTRSNDVTIDKDRVLQIKNAFLNSIAGKVNDAERGEIARALGIADIDIKFAESDQVQEMMQRRY